MYVVYFDQLLGARSTQKLVKIHNSGIKKGSHCALRDSTLLGFQSTTTNSINNAMGRAENVVPKEILRQELFFNPSQDSSIGGISAWYQGGPGFKSWLG